MNDVFVVSYMDGRTPVVTAFNNRDAASKYMQYLVKEKNTVTFDVCPVYKDFSVNPEQEVEKEPENVTPEESER